jgi:hypothetical protein
MRWEAYIGGSWSEAGPERNIVPKIKIEVVVIVIIMGRMLKLGKMKISCELVV